MMTLQLSNHTRLMNIIINLSIHSKICDPVLFNNNYKLNTIELEFNKIDGSKISIDLLLENKMLNRLLFLECKDGGLEIHQANKYMTLSNSDILTAKITDLSGEIGYEIVYIGTKDKKDKLIRDIQSGNYEFPVIIENDSIINLEYNKFSCDSLQSIFDGGINITRYSIEYYPFGKDDSDAYILSRLWPVLVQYAFSGAEFDVEDLLNATHRCYKFIDKPSVKELKGRIANILKNLSKGYLNDYFAYPSKKGFKLKSRAAKSFGEKLKKYIEKSDKKTPPEIPTNIQTNLFEFNT
jgi:hypothetical protein